MSYSTEFGFEVTENACSVEQEAAILTMQLHDIVKIYDEHGIVILVVIRVPNGYIYNIVSMNVSLFVPEYKHTLKPKR